MTLAPTTRITAQNHAYVAHANGGYIYIQQKEEDAPAKILITMHAYGADLTTANMEHMKQKYTRQYVGSFKLSGDCQSTVLSTCKTYMHAEHNE